MCANGGKRGFFKGTLRFSCFIASFENALTLRFADYTCSETNTYKKNNTHVKNRLITVQLRYERKDKEQRIDDSLVVFVLPSNFIMRNNKRVLTDSLRIVLRRPKRK